MKNSHFPVDFFPSRGLTRSILFKVKWRPVQWGLALQFIFGLLILRTSLGFKVFNGLGEQVAFFLDYSDVGASFVFGPTFKNNFFAFKVQCVIKES